jgi:hypothetical protein
MRFCQYLAEYFKQTRYSLGVNESKVFEMIQLLKICLVLAVPGWKNRFYPGGIF